MGELREHHPTQASAYNKKAFLAVLAHGDHESARGYLDEARALAEQCGDVSGLAEYHVNSCLLHSTAGELEEAGLHQLAAAELAPDLPDNLATAYHHSFGLAHVARNHILQTEYEVAALRIVDAMQFASAVGQQTFVAELLGQALPYLKMRDGDLQGAADTAAEGLALSERIGATLEAAAALHTLAWVHQLQGKWEGALREAQRSAEMSSAAGFHLASMMAFGTATAAMQALGRDVEVMQGRDAEAAQLLELPLAIRGAPPAFVDLGFCALERGELDVAEQYFERGMGIVSPSVNLSRAPLLAGSALVCVERGESERARELASEASSFVERRGMQYLMPLVALALARALEATGEADAALDELAKGQAVAGQLGALPALVDIHRETARVLTELGRTDEAADHRGAALDAVEAMAARIDDPGVAERFLIHQRSRIA
jgi:tetratricopeptide (TPR) repeat protein